MGKARAQHHGGCKDFRKVLPRGSYDSRRTVVLPALENARRRSKRSKHKKTKSKPMDLTMTGRNTYGMRGQTPREGRTAGTGKGCVCLPFFLFLISRLGESLDMFEGRKK